MSFLGISSIESRLDGCDPAAIAGLIITVDIDSVENHAVRGNSHICQEVCERMPSFANSNATTSPICVSMIVGIVASVHHRRPSAISRGRSAFRGMSVSCKAGAKDLSFAASATFGVPALQILDMDDSLCTAITETTPFRAPFIANNDEIMESLIGDVDEAWHSHSMAQTTGEC